MRICLVSIHKVRILIISVLAFICTSCFQDVIDIDLSGADDQIVIEGIISDRAGSCRVLVSKASNIYQDDSIHKVSDATVTINDGDNNIVILSETQPGVYEYTGLIGVPGKTYTLNVSDEEKKYSAISKMPVPIVLDSIRFEKINNNPARYNLSCYFKDHPGVEDYCRIKLYRNHEYLEYENILYQDMYTDGEAIAIDDIDTDFFQYDLVEIEVITIEKAIYEYYSVLFNQEEDSDDQTLIDLASANPKSNISNNALGYFSVQPIRRYSVFLR